MSSTAAFVAWVSEQISAAGLINSRKMFGEYAIYCDDKVVALVCDDQLFVKITDAGRAHVDDIAEAPPYPGAKNYFLITDELDDREWISQLIRITARALPPPKAKKQNKTRGGAGKSGAGKS